MRWSASCALRRMGASVFTRHITIPSSLEGFFGRMKVEMFFGEDWRGVAVEEFAGEVDRYIRWYNEKRVKRSLGSMSPLQYRRSLGFVA